jgi:hypothetical protein
MQCCGKIDDFKPLQGLFHPEPFALLFYYYLESMLFTRKKEVKHKN